MLSKSHEVELFAVDKELVSTDRYRPDPHREAVGILNAILRGDFHLERGV